MAQTIQTDKGAFCKHYPFTIKTGGEEKQINATGNFFICADVTGNGQPFQMAWDNEPFFDWNMGLKYVMPPGTFFSKLKFKNTLQAADIVCQMYIGSGNVDDARLTIVRGRAAPMMNAETIKTAHSTTLAAAGVLDLTAAHPTFPKYIRKATIVTNMDPAVDLEILIPGNNVMDSVLFRTTKLYEESEGIKVQNNSGAPVVLRAVQIWYVVTN